MPPEAMALTGVDARYAEIHSLGIRGAWPGLPPGERERAKAAFEDAVAAGVADGILMHRVNADEVRARHPVVEEGAGCDVGVGWAPILEEALAALDGLHVRVTCVREKCGGIQVIAPAGAGGWRKGEIGRAGEATRRAWERSLVTCEACGGPGSMRQGGWGRGRTRCDAHADIP